MGLDRLMAEMPPERIWGKRRMREKEGEVFTSYEGDIDVLREEIDELKRALLKSEDTIERLKKEVDRARAHREGVDINKVVS